MVKDLLGFRIDAWIKRITVVMVLDEAHTEGRV